MKKLAPLYQVDVMHSELGLGFTKIESVYFDDAIDAELFVHEFNDENFVKARHHDSTFLAEVAGRVI